MQPIILGGVTIDCLDPKELAEFYRKLLGWVKTYEDGSFVCIAPPAGGVRIGFQRNPDYVPPVWPEEPGKQQQMAHLDFRAKDKEDMARLVEHGILCGAQKAQEQFSEMWTVMIDPAGHPFCFDAL